jgi:hypothetical protein
MFCMYDCCFGGLVAPAGCVAGAAAWRQLATGQGRLGWAVLRHATPEMLPYKNPSTLKADSPCSVCIIAALVCSWRLLGVLQGLQHGVSWQQGRGDLGGQYRGHATSKNLPYKNPTKLNVGFPCSLCIIAALMCLCCLKGVCGFCLV